MELQTANAFGGVAPYSYAWNNGASTQTITGLTVGTYSVVVTDSEGCTTSCSVTIHPSSTPSCWASSTDTSCGMPNGSASVTASGGVAPYTYLWSNGSVNSAITGLASGTYTVTVTDSQGCTTTCSTTVGGSSAPTCTISGTDTTCGLDNGSAVGKCKRRNSSLYICLE